MVVVATAPSASNNVAFSRAALPEFSISMRYAAEFRSLRLPSRALVSKQTCTPTKFSHFSTKREIFSNPREERRPFVVQCGMNEARELMRSGTVKAIPPSQAGKLVAKDPSKSGDDSWILLDVRPEWEREKAYVEGSVHVPLFVQDDGSGALTLVKKQIQFGFGGWWLGQRLTKENEKFVAEVVASVGGRKEKKIIVACGEGLRSLLAISRLHDAGFSQLSWLGGGFSSCVNLNFHSVVGDTPLRFSTAGGVQGLLLNIAMSFDKTLKV